MFVVPEKRMNEACEATTIVDLGVREDETPQDDELGPSTKIKTKVLRLVLDGEFEFIQLDDNLVRLVRTWANLPTRWRND